MFSLVSILLALECVLLPVPSLECIFSHLFLLSKNLWIQELLLNLQFEWVWNHSSLVYCIGIQEHIWTLCIMHKLLQLLNTEATDSGFWWQQVKQWSTYLICFMPTVRVAWWSKMYFQILWELWDKAFKKKKYLALSYINIMCCFYRDHRKGGCGDVVWFTTLLGAKDEVFN